MIEFIVDNRSHSTVSNQIKDMELELREVVATLKRLQKALSQHELAISSPSVIEYRDELQETVSSALSMAQTINLQSQKLINVTEQASKHLISLEEHIGSMLRDRSNEHQAEVSRAHV